MRAEVVIAAVVPEIALLPMLVVPSKKLIVPVLPEGTVAVKVTGCVYVEGFSEELMRTFETVAVTAFEVLEL